MTSMSLLALLSSLPAFAPPLPAEGPCVAPGVCEAPPAKFTSLLPIRPRQQWNVEGGFCGSLSVQVMMMGYGAYVSEDLVRKANIGAPCFGHGDDQHGCEVGPENYNATAHGLRLRYDVWDYSQPAPQADAFKAWVKQHLRQGEPVMWAPICKGDSHTPYGPQSCPGGGHFDHHEPIIGIGSNRSLDDPTVYDDDWVLHFSLQDLRTYYRPMGSLQDGTAMQGNCKDARPNTPTGKHNEMYPCFYEDVTYGLAVKGFDIDAPMLRVTLDVDLQEEPNVRAGETAVPLHGTVHVQGLTKGAKYTLYRYKGLEALPKGAADLESSYEYKTPFTATASTLVYEDPHPFISDGATYYVAVAA